MFLRVLGVLCGFHFFRIVNQMPAVHETRRPLSKMSQLEDNLGAVDVELTPSEIAGLDVLTEPPLLYPNWFHTRTADQVSAQALGLVPAPEEKQPAAD